MTPARWPRDDRSRERLLAVDPAGDAIDDRQVADLPGLLRPGDLLVVNDAATIPASLAAATAAGEPLEVRLAGERASGEWQAVLFGPGDWRMRTEDRRPPPALGAGDVVRFGPGLSATVRAVSTVSPRLVTLAFDRAGTELWAALYRLGRPVQYSYLAGPLALWHVQTPFGSRPWAMEMPSAARPLTFGLVAELRRRGVAMAVVTHAAGLSSTGDPGLDAALPLPERYDVPEATVGAVARTKRRGARVVAVGTTVVRALEGAAAGGELRAGAGVTDLRLDADSRPRVVDGLLTGIHEPGTSHFALLGAFAPAPLLARAWSHAEASGYLGHEFGDSSLVLSGAVLR